MKKKCLLLLLVMVFQPLQAESAEEKLAEGLVNPGYEEKPDWFKESFLDIREDVDEATEAGKRVMLYFYQDGCPYCAKLLRDNFTDQRLVTTAKKHFDVVAINMWGDREVVDFKGETTTEKAFAKALKVQFTPTLVFLNETGKVLLRINGYFAPHKLLTVMNYVAEKQENKLALRDYYKHAKPEKATGKLHAEIATFGIEGNETVDLRHQQRVSKKPLLVLFEQKVCKACDELHLDVLKKPGMADSLKPFDILVLDMWSDRPVITPEGKRMKIADWAKSLNLQYTPSLLFFDLQGQEVFRTEAYLRTFHTRAALDYVASEAYRSIPEFQRYVQQRADDLHARGIEFDLMD